jgi:hypothetical protein
MASAGSESGPVTGFCVGGDEYSSYGSELLGHETQSL